MSDDVHTDRSEHDDSLLIDALYGDSDATDAARAEIDKRGLNDNLAGLAHVRELFAELEAEEPSTAGAAQLLQAAAQQAKVSTAHKPGLLSWLQGLLARPQLVAVCTLVLVATVAGTLYLRGVGVSRPEMTPVTQKDDSSAADDEPASIDEGRDRDREKFKDEEESRGMPGGDPKAASPARPKPLAKKGSKNTGGLQRAAKRPPSDYVAELSSGDTSAGASKSARRTAKEKSSKTRVAKPRQTADSQRKDISPPAPPPKIAQEPNRLNDNSPTTEATLAVDSSENKDGLESSNKLSKLRRLHKAALGAAKKGFCVEVANVDRRIGTLDQNYAEKTFRTDKALARCFASNRKRAQSQDKTKPTTKKVKKKE